MQEINNILKKYSLKPHRYESNGKVVYVDTEDGRYVVKNKKLNEEIFHYLHARSFDYFPPLISDPNDDYQITKYIEEIDIPDEQKMSDMVELTALLHNKTTHYKEIDIADYKQLYEDISNNIAYLEGYYNDLITLIETKVFMSPSEYLLARNISKIFGALAYAKQEIEKWYQLIKDKKKSRFVVLHNNLRLDHFLENRNAYLINWDKSRIDIPVFDLYKLYKNHILDFDFEEILKRYENYYPLTTDERKLFFILVALPDIIEFNDTQYNITKDISRKIDSIYKTEEFISPYNLKDEPQE